MMAAYTIVFDARVGCYEVVGAWMPWALWCATAPGFCSALSLFFAGSFPRRFYSARHSMHMIRALPSAMQAAHGQVISGNSQRQAGQGEGVVLSCSKLHHCSWAEEHTRPSMATNPPNQAEQCEHARDRLTRGYQKRAQHCVHTPFLWRGCMLAPIASKSLTHARAHAKLLTSIRFQKHSSCRPPGLGGRQQQQTHSARRTRAAGQRAGPGKPGRQARGCCSLGVIPPPVVIEEPAPPCTLAASWRPSIVGAVPRGAEDCRRTHYSPV
jgi:hypothetical protein